MRPWTRILTCLVLLAPAATPATADEGMVRKLDIPYASIEGVKPNLLSLDLYAPSSGEKHPVFVFIHGGGHTKGDKSKGAGAERKARLFTTAGWVFVSVNYRLSPAVQHPAHVQDVAAALAWAHDHVREHGGDPDRIFLGGHSAGGHLAGLVATDERRLAKHEKGLSILKGVVLLDTGGYDLVGRMRSERPGPQEVNKLHAVYGKDLETALADASMTPHVTSGKDIPPMLVFYTVSARRDGAPLASDFVAALEKAGVPAQAFAAPDRTHGEINSCIGAPGDRYTKVMMEFLAAPAKARDLRIDPLDASSPKPPADGEDDPQ